MKQALTSDELWRVFIDGELQAEENWLGFEAREPGYLGAMYKAWKYVVATLGQPVTGEWICELHRLCTTNVIRHHKSRNDAYRVTDIRIPLRDNMTVDGIIHLLKKIHADPEAIYCLDSDAPVASVADNYLCHETLQLLVPADNQEAYFKTMAEGIVTSRLFFLTSVQAKKLKPVLKEGGIEYELDRYCQDLSDPDYPGTVIPQSDQRIAEKLTAACDAFNQEIGAAEDTLLSIADFVQHLEQIHPFYDGNCRTLVMLLLNKLLLEQDFGMAILRDPNSFDAFSPLELKAEIRAGIAERERLEQQGTLHAVNTKALTANSIQHQLLLYGAGAVLEGKAEPLVIAGKMLQNMFLCNLNLNGLRFKNCLLTDVNFAGSEIDGLILENCNFHRLRFAASANLAPFITSNINDIKAREIAPALKESLVLQFLNTLLQNTLLSPSQKFAIYQALKQQEPLHGPQSKGLKECIVHRLEDDFLKLMKQGEMPQLDKSSRQLLDNLMREDKQLASRSSPPRRFEEYKRLQQELQMFSELLEGEASASGPRRGSAP